MNASEYNKIVNVSLARRQIETFIAENAWVRGFQRHERIAMAVIELHDCRPPGTAALLHLIMAAMDIVTPEV